KGIGQIVGQPAQQFHLGGRYGVRLRGVEDERAEHPPLIPQWQRDGGGVTAPKRRLAPGREVGIGQQVLTDHRLTGANGRASGTAPGRGVVPGDFNRFEIALLEASL
ncbi:hypothetical protein RZS08_55855, partial [Arthrospira platensis SPKY1]|nr:hypothetical protein [Arthrospira platensis SPKY1]